MDISRDSRDTITRWAGSAEKEAFFNTDTIKSLSETDDGRGEVHLLNERSYIIERIIMQFPLLPSNWREFLHGDGDKAQRQAHPC